MTITARTRLQLELQRETILDGRGLPEHKSPGQWPFCGGAALVEPLWGSG